MRRGKCSSMSEIRAADVFKVFELRKRSFGNISGSLDGDARAVRGSTGMRTDAAMGWRTSQQQHINIYDLTLFGICSVFQVPRQENITVGRSCCLERSLSDPSVLSAPPPPPPPPSSPVSSPHPDMSRPHGGVGAARIYRHDRQRRGDEVH